MFKSPVTGKSRVHSTIRDEIWFPSQREDDYVTDEWGTYVFGAWLEEDSKSPGAFIISFPYYRNGRFAGQYSLRAEPLVIRRLFDEIQKRGWLRKKGWSDLESTARRRPGRAAR